MNTRCLSAILAAVFLAAGLPSVANVSIALSADTNAISSNEALFSRYSPNLFGRIDYAVYDHDDFTLLSFPNKYVYCYQLFTDSSSVTGINLFKVQLPPDVIAYSPTSLNNPALGMPTDMSPPAASFNVNTGIVSYNFGRNVISANKNSPVLIFASDFLTMNTVTISSPTGSDISIQLPAPTPEPASLLLLALASPVLLRIRRRKS